MKRLGLAFTMGLWLVACDGGTSGSGGGATTTTDDPTTGGGGATTSAMTGGGGTGATGGAGGTGATGGAGGTGAGGTGAGGTGGGAVAGSCGRRCTQDVDCCPMGLSGCPGPYPKNFTCLPPDQNGERVCQGAQCASNAECVSSGLVGHECKSLFGSSSNVCVKPCQMGMDCTVPTTCIGMADDGTKYCTIESPPFMCAPGDGQCSGYGECAPSGDKCVCTSDDQCDDGNFLKDCIGLGQ